MKELAEFAPRFLNNMRQIGNHLSNSRNYLERDDLDNTLWHLGCVKMILENEVNEVIKILDIISQAKQIEEDNKEKEPESHANN